MDRIHCQRLRANDLRPLGYQIIDHDTDVCLIPSEDQRLFAKQFGAGIDAGYYALTCRFLIPAGAVYLTGAEQPFYAL